MATMAISQEDRIGDLRSPAPRHRRCSIRLDWWPMQTNGVRPIEKVNWPPPWTPLANNPPGTGDDARLEFTYRQGGFYSIVVLSSAAGTYTLSVTEQSRHRNDRNNSGGNHASSNEQETLRPPYTQRPYRLATKNLPSAASHLTEQPRNPRSTDKPETPKPATAHLIHAGQRYRTDPSIAACERLLAMAIRWYSVEVQELNMTSHT